MPEVKKKQGEQFILAGTIRNIGNTTINLGIAVVLSGPKTYGMSVKDIGNLAPNQQFPLYYVEYIPSDAPAGRYDVLVSAIDRTIGQEFQRIDTLWDIIVEVITPIKKIELLNVSVS
ncbi:MAG: hypothetical protein NC827_05980 [Candidatus Omnitrophica bacterium]|nr:hypothetical protein [Candidatus Omnitrophota bacterium]